MFSFLNNCCWTATAGGTADFTVGSAAFGGYKPADCLIPSVVASGNYHYAAILINAAGVVLAHEEGDGVYSGGVLTRATIRNSSSAGAKVNFASAPVVFMGNAAANDIVAPFTLDSGTITASSPALTIKQTWNNGAAYFTAISVEITNTASGSPAAGTYNKFCDYKIGGVSQIAFLTEVNKGEGGYGPAIAWPNAGNGGAFLVGTNDGSIQVGFALSSGSGSYSAAIGVGGVRTSSSWGYFWGSSPQDFAQDTGLMRAAAGVVKAVSDTGGTLADITARAFRANVTTVANLPASPVVGMVCAVNNANAPAIGANVAGGGAANALVWWNGANWTVIGV